MIKLKEHIQMGRKLNIAALGVIDAHVALGSTHRKADTDGFFRIENNIASAKSDCEEIMFADHPVFTRMEGSMAGFEIYYGQDGYIPPSLPKALKLLCEVRETLDSYQSTYKRCRRWTGAVTPLNRAIDQIERFLTKWPAMKPRRNNSPINLRQAQAACEGWRAVISEIEGERRLARSDRVA